MKEDFEQDEMIDVRLPRYQYEVLKNVIKREEAYGWFKASLSSNWIFVIGGGLLTLFLLWEKIQNFLMGPK